MEGDTFLGLRRGDHKYQHAYLAFSPKFIVKKPKASVGSNMFQPLGVPGLASQFGDFPDRAFCQVSTQTRYARDAKSFISHSKKTKLMR